MSKSRQLIALIVISGLTLVIMLGLFSVDHMNHTICPISVFYGVDCLFMDGAFPLAARKITTAVVENYAAAILMLIFAFIFVITAHIHKRMSAFSSEILLIIKYRIRQAGAFLAAFFHTFLRWLVFRNKSVDRDAALNLYGRMAPIIL